MITKCDSYNKVIHNLLQIVGGITKCDKGLLQSVTVITKWDIATVNSRFSRRPFSHWETQNEALIADYERKREGPRQEYETKYLVSFSTASIFKII